MTSAKLSSLVFRLLTSLNTRLDKMVAAADKEFEGVTLFEVTVDPEAIAKEGRALCRLVKHYTILYKLYYRACEVVKDKTVLDSMQLSVCELELKVRDSDFLFSYAEHIADPHAPSVLQKIVDDAWVGEYEFTPWFVDEEWFKWLKHENSEDFTLLFDHILALHEGEQPKTTRWDHVINRKV